MKKMILDEIFLVLFYCNILFKNRTTKKKEISLKFVRKLLPVSDDFDPNTPNILKKQISK